MLGKLKQLCSIPALNMSQIQMQRFIKTHKLAGLWATFKVFTKKKKKEKIVSFTDNMTTVA